MIVNPLIARIFAPLVSLVFFTLPSLADVVDATYNTGAEVPIMANGYTATGNTVNFSLNYAPVAGAQLMVVKNTGPGFITGTFDNLAQGQKVALTYNGVTYNFVANYYGGTGNDLVLTWAGNHIVAVDSNSGIPLPVSSTGVLAGKTVLTVAGGGGNLLALCSDGTVGAWGVNTDGSLGNNSTTGSAVPVAVDTNAADG